MDASKNRSSHGAMSLSREDVTCASIWKRESDRIFNRHWLCVGRASDLHPESKCLHVEIENNLLLVTRSSRNELKAFHNICRHRGSRLVDDSNCGTIGSKIVCPYHAWSYDRDGTLVAAPNMQEVDTFDRSEYGLRSVGCREWEGFIFVKLDGESGFDEYISELNPLVKPWSIGDLAKHAVIEYEVAANWKLIFQNYSECYHCPTVHPILNQLTPYKGSDNNLDSGAILGGPMMLSDNAKTMSMDGKAAAMPLPGLNETQKRSVAYYTLFPSKFLSVHPDYVLVHRLQRIATNKTKVVCEFLFHSAAIEDRSFSPTAALEFWDLTNRQDWHVCELAQSGMSADGYVPGPYSNLESVVAAFDRHYREVMR